MIHEPSMIHIVSRNADSLVRGTFVFAPIIHMQLSITYSAGKRKEPSTYSHMSDVGVVERV